MLWKKITIGNLINRLKKTLKIKTRTSFIYIILLICLILILVFLEQSFHVSWVSAVVEISAGYTADGRIYASCLRIPEQSHGIIFAELLWTRDFIAQELLKKGLYFQGFLNKGLHVERFLKKGLPKNGLYYKGILHNWLNVQWYLNKGFYVQGLLKKGFHVQGLLNKTITCSLFKDYMLKYYWTRYSMFKDY